MRHRAVHRDLLTGTDTDKISHPQERDRDLFLLTISHTTGGFRLQSHQALDSGRSAVLRPLLQKFTQQNECYDHAGCLIINMRLQSFLIPELRVYGIEETEQESDRGTQRHQCIHIGATVQRMAHAVHVERLPEHDHNHQGQRHHDPVTAGRMHKHHSQQGQRNGKYPRPDRTPA